MQKLAIDQAHDGARVRALTAALALAILPVSARAQPGADAAPPEIPEIDMGEFEPVEIVPAPLPEREPEPEPTSEPVVEPPAEAPSALDEGPSPAEIAKVQTMRRASIGLIASGGVVATTGLGLTIAFSVLGHRAQNRDAPMIEDIEQQNAAAQVGGILLASGIAVVAVGGIIFASAKRKAESQATARVRVAPAIGGLVVSGRF